MPTTGAKMTADATIAFILDLNAEVNFNSPHTSSLAIDDSAR